jgi:hypothetical protein
VNASTAFPCMTMEQAILRNARVLYRIGEWHKESG